MSTKATTIAAYALAAIFLLMGAAKFLAREMNDTQFTAWGYPTWFAFVVGTMELAGAILVVLPRTRQIGAGLIALVMAGAIVTHLRVPEIGLLPLAIPLLAVSGWLAWRLRNARAAATAPA